MKKAEGKKDEDRRDLTDDEKCEKSVDRDKNLILTIERCD